MARKIIIGEILNLIRGLGGNPNKFMGTKTNVSFLGKGPQESLFQGAIDIEGMVKSGFPIEKVIAESEKVGGYVTSGKLNDLQLQRLRDNLAQLKQAYKPEQLANITDMASGARDLTQEGLGSLRALQKFPKESHKFMGRPLKEKDFAEIDELVKRGKLPGPGKSFLEEMGARGHKVLKPGTPEYAAYTKKGLRTFPGDLDLPQKTHSARATLLRMLDVYPSGQEGVGTTLREIMSPKELKWVLEGGGGAEGNPIALIAKYFGPAVAKNIPVKGTPKVIEEFITKIIRLKDRQGRGVEDPFFSRTEIDFAGGGLAHILQMPRSGYSKGKVVKSLMGLVNKRFGKGTLKQASDLPKGTKYETLEAVKDFEKRTKIDDLGGYKIVEKDFDFSDMHILEPAAQLKQLIIQKYKGRINDKLLQQMLADDNPQRLAEVMATVDEALLMQAKGMNPESIMTTLKDSWKRKPSASGGLARILEI